MPKAKNILDKRKEEISLKTLRMPSAMAGVMGQSKDEAKKILKGLGYSDEEIKKLSERKNKETTMEDKKLREFIRAKVIEFLTEQKILIEADSKKTGKIKSSPTSGMETLKVGDTHTEKNKGEKPNFKVSDIGPNEKTFLTGTEPEPVGNETKEVEDKTDEALLKGKYPGSTADNFKGECMGVDLEVKGSSYAEINSLYLIAQIRKALEGRGEFVKKVTIEMGKPDELTESADVKKLRSKIRNIIKEELKKKF